MLQAFLPIPTPDKILTQVQALLKRIFDRLTRNPLLDGNWIPAVSLASGNNTIGHGLGRNYVGVLCTPPSVAGITLQEVAQADRSQTVIINASGACTINIYVF